MGWDVLGSIAELGASVMMPELGAGLGELLAPTLSEGLTALDIGTNAATGLATGAETLGSALATAGLDAGLAAAEGGSPLGGAVSGALSGALNAGSGGTNLDGTAMTSNAADIASSIPGVSQSIGTSLVKGLGNVAGSTLGAAATGGNIGQAALQGAESGLMSGVLSSNNINPVGYITDQISGLTSSTPTLTGTADTSGTSTSSGNTVGAPAPTPVTVSPLPDASSASQGATISGAVNTTGGTGAGASALVSGSDYTDPTSTLNQQALNSPVGQLLQSPDITKTNTSLLSSVENLFSPTTPAPTTPTTPTSSNPNATIMGNQTGTGMANDLLPSVSVDISGDTGLKDYVTAVNKSITAQDAPNNPSSMSSPLNPAAVDANGNSIYTGVTNGQTLNNLIGGYTNVAAPTSSTTPSVSSANSITSSLPSLSTVGTLATLGALGASVAAGTQQPQYTTQAANAAGSQNTVAQQLITDYNAGTLPAWFQSALQSQIAQDQAAIRTQYAQAGNSGSSAEQADLQAVQNRVLTEQGTMLQQMLNAGTAAQQSAAGTYTSLMNQGLSQDQALTSSMSSLASAIAAGQYSPTTQTASSASTGTGTSG